jgi:hypothetical protein
MDPMRIAGEFLKSVAPDAAHLKNKLIHGKEKAEEIRKEKFGKRRRKDVLTANIFGLFIGVPCAFSMGMLSGLVGALQGIALGLFVCWLFRWIGYNANPYR